MTQEKVFGKRGAAVFGYICTIAVLLVMVFSVDADNKTPLFIIGGLFIFILASKAWSIMQEKVIFGKDSLTIKKGRIFKTIEDIRYEKINNIKISSFETIEIMVWNDKPIIFRRLDQCGEVKRLLDQKISWNVKGNSESQKGEDNLDKIEKLSKLYKEGVLTKEEFDKKKKSLLEI